MKIQIINKSKHPLPQYATPFSAGIGPRAMLELDKELKKRGIHYKQNHTV